MVCEMTPHDPTLPAVGPQSNRTEADMRVGKDYEDGGCAGKRTGAMIPPSATTRENRAILTRTALDPRQPWPFGAGKPIKESTDDLPEAMW